MVGRPRPGPRRFRKLPRGTALQRHPGSPLSGWPWVKVPVLSTTTMSTLASRSNASGRVTRSPRRASRVVAAAIAAGVASDKAHGQVTTSTSQRRRKRLGGIDKEPKRAAARGERHREHHEQGSHAVCGAGDRSALRLLFAREDPRYSPTSTRMCVLLRERGLDGLCDGATEYRIVSRA